MDSRPRCRAAVAGALAALVAGGCGQASEAEPAPRPQAPVRVLEYNVKAHLTLGDEPARSSRIADQVANIAPALMGFSECDRCERLLEQMPGEHELVGDGRAGVAAAYDASLWSARDHGFLILGENDDGWGERVALWAVLEEVATGAPILFYSTHWCVPSRSPDDRCDLARQVEYARLIVDHAADLGSLMPVIVTGDLNVREEVENAAALRVFAGAGYVDTLRALDPTGEISTLDSGDGLRVDYTFASSPVDVLDAYVDQTVPFELGSDHWPTVSTVSFH